MNQGKQSVTEKQNVKAEDVTSQSRAPIVGGSFQLVLRSAPATAVDEWCNS